jgi:hypothetical protein
LRSVSTAELAAHPLAYRPRRQEKNTEFVPYQGVWRSFIITAPLAADAAGPREKFTDRVLVLWSAGKAQLDGQKRRTYLKRLLDGLENIRRQLNQGQYSRRDYTVAQINHWQRGNPAKRLVPVDLQGEDGQLELTFRLDRDRLAAAQAVDGRYALGTNAPDLSADDALRIFKAQDDAEKQFRTVKGPLAIRPVFLHNDQRIEGLVWVTLVALLVRALLTWQCQQAGLSLSADRILAEFAAWAVIDLTLVDGTHLLQVPSPTEAQAQVMQALGVPPCERYLTTRPARVDP